MGLFKRSPKIRIVYRNGNRDKVTPELLTSLIQTNEIAQFQRSDGWVTIGIDRVRGMGGPPYLGENRRST